MLRGAVIIFTGIMSVIFLGKKLRLYHWCGMILVLLGLSCVGVARYTRPKVLSNVCSVIYTDGNTSGASHPLLGDVVIICAQVWLLLSVSHAFRL
jgi:drug/metabolite transporter (DMT)-like permease